MRTFVKRLVMHDEITMEDLQEGAPYIDPITGSFYLDEED
jgi:hypothetical protein